MVVKEEYKFNNDSEEIDLKEFLNFFLRNKYFLSIFIIFGSLFGYITYLLTPKIWQGEFQIVISNAQNSQVGSTSAGLLAGKFLNDFPDKEISTQIIILESPSVLLDTFEYVKKENKEDNLLFENWKKRLTVEQEKDSSVLNIKYQDSSKPIVLPVLEKVSSTYQEYSNKKRVKSINIKIKYLEEEVKKYTKLTYDSIIKSQKYSKDFAITSYKIGDEIIDIITDVEKNSFNAKNLIKGLDQKLKNIKGITNFKELIYYAEIYNLALPLTTEINNIDKKIINYSNQFKDNDIIILNLKETKNELTKSLKNAIISSLEAQKDDALITLEANKRGANEIFNYKKLLIESTKNSKALENLENELLILNLERSKDGEPWDLITNPTLIPNYVYPRKVKNIIQYGLISFLIGTIILFLLEKNNNIIKRKTEVKNFISTNEIFELTLSANEIIEDELELLIETIKDDQSEKIIITSLCVNDNLVNQICNSLNNKISNKFLISDKVSDLAKYKKIVPIITLNKTSKESLNKFKSKVDNLKLEILNLIIISNYNE